MNIKSIFAMLGILVLGFALGFLTAGQFTKRHVNHIRKIGTAKGFQERFYEKVQLNETQKQKLSPILKNFSKDFHQAHIDFKGLRTSLLDSLEQKVQGELDDSQKENLTKLIKKLKKPPHLRKKKKGKKKKRKEEGKK